MNPLISPEIPQWNFNYFTINEVEIEKEECKLEEETKHLTQQEKSPKIPGIDSTDQEEGSDNEDDDVDQSDDHPEWDIGGDQLNIDEEGDELLDF